MTKLDKLKDKQKQFIKIKRRKSIGWVFCDMKGFCVAFAGSKRPT